MRKHRREKFALDTDFVLIEGHPATAHWGVPDPAAARGTAEEIRRAYRETFLAMERRIDLFLSLPHATIEKAALQQAIDEIGQV